MNFSEFKTQFNINLNPQQEAAVQAVDGPVLLLAVPGSGKTTVLVTRLGYMLYARGIQPKRILTMTYTVAATRDMRERFASMFGNKLADRLEFRTINSLSNDIIHHYERTLGRKAFDLLLDAGKASIIGEIYRQNAEDFATESTIKTIQTAITYTKNMMLADEEIEALELEGLKFAPIYHEYCRVLKNRNLMDFDDQMVYAHQILRRYKDILHHFQKRFSYFSVDEAQDTSRIQHEIIRLLAQESGNLFMVGDEDQSIYGFRAAYPEALMEFEQVYPGAKILLMEKNYRSTQQIVSAADKFIRQNIKRHPKRMTAVSGNGKDVSEIYVNDRRGQYRYLLAVAKDCKTETAVLYRDNDSALPVIDLLDRAGISYCCRQVDSTFFSHWVIRDITDIIRFARDPFDSEVFLRIYYKLGAGISKAVAEASVKKSAKNKCPILECLIEQSGISSWTKKHSKALQTHFTNLISEPADRAVYRIVNFMGSGALSAEGTIVTMPSVSGVSVYAVGIPVPDLSTENEQGILTVNTGTGSLTVPSNMLTGTEGVIGSKAQISIRAGDKDSLPAEVKETIGNRPLLSLTLSIDGNHTDWSNPAAPVTVSISYTPMPEELENPESIVVWYIDGSGNVVTIPNGRYDAATGTVTFSTTHFSDYAVAYNRVSFSDVAADSWYSEAVSFIAARKISNGTDDGTTYSPDAKLTRGEFIVLTMRAYEIAPDTNPTDNFVDAGNTYYTGYLAAAKRLGISTGVGDNRFTPEQVITRQEMFTLQYNALKVLEKLPEGDCGKTLSDFTDSGSIAAYAQEAMTSLVKSGTISGSDGKLDPNVGSTRAQMAQVLYNLLKN